MTAEERTALKVAIDAARRKKIAASYVPSVKWCCISCGIVLAEGYTDDCQTCIWRRQRKEVRRRRALQSANHS